MWITLLSMWVGCTTDPDPTTPEPSEDALLVCNTPVEPTPGCTSAIGEAWPAPDALVYRGVMEVTFQQQEEEAALDLCLSQGDAAVAFTSSLSLDGRTLQVTPSDALEPDTEYTLGVRYSCGAGETFTWRTTSAGPAIEPADLAGRTWQVDFTHARVPGAPASILQGLLGGTQLFLGAVAGDAGLQLRWGYGIEAEGSWVQDLCVATADAALGLLPENPWLTLEAPAVALSGGSAPVYAELRLTGAFTPDLGAIDGAALDLVLDLRDGSLASADGGACAFGDAMGIACVPCADGAPSCLPVRVEGVGLEEVPGFSLAAVSPEEALSCAAEGPTPE